MTTLERLEDYQERCDNCDGQRYVLDAVGDRAVAHTCEACFDVCPACDGEEFQYVTDDQGYSYARRCAVCGPLNRRIEAFNAARIPARYRGRDARLQEFEKTDAQGKPLGNLQDLHMKIYRWTQGFTPGDRGFVLYGPVGTGKTHLMVAVLRHLLLQKGVPSRFIEFTHLLSEIKQQFDAGKGESEIMAPLAEIEVLAIDELGKGRNTPWQLSIIDEIISKRYNRGLTTLFTTNYPLREPKLDANASDAKLKQQMTQETLVERVDQRIFSRLHEMVDFLELDAPDYRKRNN
ncbi:MAG: AFG1/ZapE family ATPase [Myxococcota bacterium]